MKFVKVSNIFKARGSGLPLAMFVPVRNTLRSAKVRAGGGRLNGIVLAEGSLVLCLELG